MDLVSRPRMLPTMEPTLEGALEGASEGALDGEGECPLLLLLLLCFVWEVCLEACDLAFDLLE